MHVEYLGCNSLQGLQQHSYVDHLHISMHPCQAIYFASLSVIYLFKFCLSQFKKRVHQHCTAAWAAIIKAQKASSALFAASAACDHMRDWVLGTPKVDSLSSQIAFDHAELVCFYILLPLFFFLFIYLKIIIIFCKFSFGFVIQGTWVSMGVYSDGSYGIPKDIIYSFPVKCEKGKWSIVKGKFCAFYML